MKVPWIFRGMRVVAQQEFLGNLKGIRFIIMAIILGLVVVGGSYGISGIVGGGGPPPLAVWTHTAYGPGGEHIAVAWVADPFGNPLSDRPVEFLEATGDGQQQLIAEVRTDADGFARWDVGTRDMVFVVARLGTVSVSTTISFFAAAPPPFTAAYHLDDVDGDGLEDDMGVHVTDGGGDPVSARVLVNGTEVGTVNARGYLRIELPAGDSNVTVEVGAARETTRWFASERPPAFEAGPDVVLLIMSAGFSLLIVPIFAIVISFDAVSKERVQGTMDLLLSRPASRSGILLGKFVGAFAAVAVPVTLVNLAGIGAIAVASGESPTGSFASAFVLLSLLLIAFYVLLQITLSTLAKTSGTAVLFGVLVWLTFNLLYNIVVLVIGAVIADPQAQFQFNQLAPLGNPSAIYSGLVVLAAPRELQGGFGGVTLDPWVLGVAGVVWFVVLLALALWTFHRKAAE